ncbi:hypothetical protein KI387_043085, partial [Taxus chinensis]
MASTTSIPTPKFQYKNLMCPQIVALLREKDAQKDWVKNSEFTGLVDMPQFDTDTSVLDYLLASYNENDGKFSVLLVHLRRRQISFSIEPEDVHRLTGLPFKNKPVVTTKVVLTDEDKKFLESHYNVQVDAYYEILQYKIPTAINDQMIGLTLEEQQ